MTFLGSSGLYLNDTANNIMTTAICDDLATSQFVMLENITSNPIVITILSVAALITIVLFFVTSSDSSSLVVNNLTSGGKLHSLKSQRVFWAVMEGFIDAAALLLGGTEALTSLKSITIITGLSFSIMIVTIIVSLILQFVKDEKKGLILN